MTVIIHNLSDLALMTATIHNLSGLALITVIIHNLSGLALMPSVVMDRHYDSDSPHTLTAVACIILSCFHV